MSEVVSPFTILHDKTRSHPTKIASLMPDWIKNPIVFEEPTIKYPLSDNNILSKKIKKKLMKMNIETLYPGLNRLIKC